MEIDEPIERLEAERDSFDRLLRPELASAYRLAGYLLCDASAAEDAAQEAVLRAWRAYPPCLHPSAMIRSNGRIS